MRPEPYDVMMDTMATGQYEAVQASLWGVWRIKRDGCPHRHGSVEGVDRCDANEMRVCVYETGNGPCDLFLEIIKHEMRLLCRGVGNMTKYTVSLTGDYDADSIDVEKEE